MKAPTLRDIAAAGGVSHVTVSLALRNHSRIPEPTRTRIQALAAEMGYRPSALLQALSQRMRAGAVAGYSPVIAFINPFRSLEEWSALPTMRKFHEGARARADALGYTLDTLWLGEAGMTSARINKILDARGICGIILGMLPAARGHLSLRWEKRAISTQGYTVMRPEFHRSCHHHFESMGLVLREARRLGARRIGLALTRELSARVNHLWLGAFTAAEQLIPEKNRVAPWLGVTLDEAAFDSWLATERPDFVVTAHSVIGEWLDTRGSGETVPFAHLDLHTELRPGWMGIDQNQAAVGARAVELVIEQLQLGEFGPPPAPKVVLTPGRWVGPSTRA